MSVSFLVTKYSYSILKLPAFTGAGKRERRETRGLLSPCPSCFLRSNKLFYSTLTLPASVGTGTEEEGLGCPLFFA